MLGPWNAGRPTKDNKVQLVEITVYYVHGMLVGLQKMTMYS